MLLLSALVLLCIPMSPAARAAPLFCYWIESSHAATAGRALGQDGRVREIKTDSRQPLDQVIRSLERVEPLGDPIPSERMARVRALVVASSMGPYRDTPGVRSSWMDPHTIVACVVAGTGQRPATVTLRECHNATHTNAAVAAPELMTNLSDLLSPTKSTPSEAERIIRSISSCH